MPAEGIKADVKVFIGLTALFLAFSASWLLLDHYRDQFYDNSVIGGPSPYLVIVQLQKAIRWPIVFFASCSLLSTITVLIRRIKARSP